MKSSLGCFYFLDMRSTGAMWDCCSLQVSCTVSRKRIGCCVRPRFGPRLLPEKMPPSQQNRFFDAGTIDFTWIARTGKTIP